jgi:hypothetical protein
MTKSDLIKIKLLKEKIEKMTGRKVKFMEADLTPKQEKNIDKNKNGKIDANDFDILKDEKEKGTEVKKEPAPKKAIAKPAPKKAIAKPAPKKAIAKPAPKKAIAKPAPKTVAKKK